MHSSLHSLHGQIGRNASSSVAARRTNNAPQGLERQGINRCHRRHSSPHNMLILSGWPQDIRLVPVEAGAAVESIP